MPPEPPVSVVIPCFRQGHLLAGAVESVLAQTHPGVEAVVVNDGSDDDTDAVARRYLPRIRYVSQANAGLAAARNAGAAAAAGRFLLFLDADDLLHPDGVRHLLAANDGRDDVLAACGWHTFATDPDVPVCGLESPAAGDLLPRLIHNNVGPPNVFLVPRRAFENVGRFATDLRYRGCEDWDLWTRLALAGVGFAATPQLGAYYRAAAGSMSTNRPQMMAARVEVLLRAFDRTAADPALLARWGGEFATAVRRVRRRLRLQRLHPDLVPQLTAILHRLAAAGHTPAASWKEALLTRLVGADRGDRLMLGYFRWVDKASLAYYQRGIA